MLSVQTAMSEARGSATGSSPGTTPTTTPSSYARGLLDSLGRAELPLILDDRRDPDLLWAASGAMWLSGHEAGRMRHCAAPLAACAQGAWLALASLSPKDFDPHFAAHALLGERAALAGLQRQGRRSPGGACALYETADGMLALNLTREDDFSLLPAWLEAPVLSEDDLPELIRQHCRDELVARGRMLGLATAPLAVPVTMPPTAGSSSSGRWFRATNFVPSLPAESRSPLVVDMSSLWAGPLCGQLLRQTGARVIKLESVSRPDGARLGPKAFFELMNEGKESLALDHRDAADRQRMHAILSRADIVIESSRPRGLEQMGIYAEELLAAKPGKVWLAISGYGRGEPERNWVAYGDDAGVAAGLPLLMDTPASAFSNRNDDDTDPVFCGDAIADPLTGLHAALLAVSSWRAGGGQLLDIALRDVLAYCVELRREAGSATCPELSLGVDVASPSARQATMLAPALGEHNESLMQEFGL